MGRQAIIDELLEQYENYLKNLTLKDLERLLKEEESFKLS